jgi:hypothetical protein
MAIDPVFDRRMSLRRRWKHVIFLSLRIFILPLSRVLMRLKTIGTQHIPRRGGAVIVANHNHNADPILIYIATIRPIFFMTKVAIWNYAIPRWVATQAGAFPVDRDRVDRDAIRTAVTHLTDGFRRLDQAGSRRKHDCGACRRAHHPVRHRRRVRSPVQRRKAGAAQAALPQGSRAVRRTVPAGHPCARWVTLSL